MSGLVVPRSHPHPATRLGPPRRRLRDRVLVLWYGLTRQRLSPVTLEVRDGRSVPREFRSTQQRRP